MRRRPFRLASIRLPAQLAYHQSSREISVCVTRRRSEISVHRVRLVRKFAQVINGVDLAPFQVGDVIRLRGHRMEAHRQGLGRAAAERRGSC